MDAIIRFYKTLFFIGAYSAAFVWSFFAIKLLWDGNIGPAITFGVLAVITIAVLVTLWRSEKQKGAVRNFKRAARLSKRTSRLASAFGDKERGHRLKRLLKLCKLEAAYAAIAFRFPRQPSIPNAARPVTRRGSVAGSGVGEGTASVAICTNRKSSSVLPMLELTAMVSGSVQGILSPQLNQ